MRLVGAEGFPLARNSVLTRHVLSRKQRDGTQIITKEREKRTNHILKKHNKNCAVVSIDPTLLFRTSFVLVSYLGFSVLPRAMAISSDVRCGLIDGEIVLRGGLLPKPIVFADLETIDGRLFCKLSHRSSALVLFLTGQSVCKHPMAHSCLQEVFLQLRHERVLEMLCSPSGAPQEEAAVDELDLEDGVESKPGASTPCPKRLCGLKRAVRAQHPFVTIAFPVGIATVHIRVATAITLAQPPSFEATQDNFDAIFKWFAEEAPVRAEKAAASRSFLPRTAQHPPADCSGARKYFRGDKGVFIVKRKLDKPHGERSKYKVSVAERRQRSRRTAPGSRVRPGSSSSSILTMESGSQEDSF